MRNESLDDVVSPEDPSLSPGEEVRAQLGTGMMAALSAGVLAAASSVAELSQNGAAGFTPAHALAWAALLPLLLVLRAYLVLARETQSPGLRTSSLCLFGAVVLLNVADLALVDALPWGVRLTIWVVFGIGLLALLAAPFASRSEAAQSPAETPALDPETEAAPARTRRAGLIGALAVGLAVLLKLAAKGFFLKVLVARWAVRALGCLNGEVMETAAVGVVLLLATVFVVWFAVCKIRLRGQLGGRAALVGWMEILLVVLFAGLITWQGITVAAAAGQPGIADKVLQAVVDHARETTILGGIAGMLAWSTLTAALFGAARTRLAPVQE